MQLPFAAASANLNPCNSQSSAKMMHMTFYWGRQAVILFDSWKTDSWISYALTLVALFLVGAFYQYMEDRRIRFKIVANSKPTAPIQVPFLPRSAAPRGWSAARFAVAILFGVNSAIGYLLMLSVMSFNGGVFIAIVLGLTVGFLFFRSGAEDEVVELEPACACA